MGLITGIIFTIFSVSVLQYWIFIGLGIITICGLQIYYHLNIKDHSKPIGKLLLNNDGIKIQTEEALHYNFLEIEKIVLYLDGYFDQFDKGRAGLYGKTKRGYNNTVSIYLPKEKVHHHFYLNTKMQLDVTLRYFKL